MTGYCRGFAKSLGLCMGYEVALEKDHEGNRPTG